MKIKTTRSFDKSVKKLKPHQKKALDSAVRELISEPLQGQKKKGDLSYMRVHKFKMVNQVTLLGYEYEDGDIILTLLKFGPHENFYRDMKRIL